MSCDNLNCLQVAGMGLYLYECKKKGKTPRTVSVCNNGHCGRSKCGCPGGKIPRRVQNYESGASLIDGYEYGLVNKKSGLACVPTGPKGDSLLLKTSVGYVVQRKHVAFKLPVDQLVIDVCHHLSMRYDLPFTKGFGRVQGIIDLALEQARKQVEESERVERELVESERVECQPEKDQGDANTIVERLITAMTVSSTNHQQSLKRHDISDQRHDKSDERHDKSDERHDINDQKISALDRQQLQSAKKVSALDHQQLESAKKISTLQHEFEEWKKSQIQPPAALNLSDSFAAACPVTPMTTPAPQRLAPQREPAPEPELASAPQCFAPECEPAPQRLALEREPAPQRECEATNNSRHDACEYLVDSLDERQHVSERRIDVSERRIDVSKLRHDKSDGRHDACEYLVDSLDERQHVSERRHDKSDQLHRLSAKKVSSLAHRQLLLEQKMNNWENNEST